MDPRASNGPPLSHMLHRLICVQPASPLCLFTSSWGCYNVRAVLREPILAASCHADGKSSLSRALLGGPVGSRGLDPGCATVSS